MHTASGIYRNISRRSPRTKVPRSRLQTKHYGPGIRTQEATGMAARPLFSEHSSRSGRLAA